MRARLLPITLAGALLITVAWMMPAAATLDEPTEIDPRGVADNNAADNARALRQARLLYFHSQPALLRYLMSTMEGRYFLYRYWLFRQLYWRPAPPQAQPGPASETQLVDLPAESILDELDDNEPLPMVGMPGSGTAMNAFDELGDGPPPETSILDEIDESPKPAVNRAAPPPVQPR
jgi:hypothetical protein